MACEKKIQLMHDYLDGQLSLVDEKDLSAHLQECESCQAHFHELSRTITLIQSTQKLNAPINFTEDVMNKLPQEKKHMKYRRWFNNHPYLATAILLLFFFIGSLFSGWDKNNKLVVSKIDNLVIEGNTVIVPEDIIVTGDLFIKNGNLKVNGQIEGNVTLVNGELLTDKGLSASLDNISGELKHIDQALKWAWYEMNKFFEELLGFK